MLPFDSDPKVHYIAAFTLQGSIENAVPNFPELLKQAGVSQTQIDDFLGLVRKESLGSFMTCSKIPDFSGIHALIIPCLPEQADLSAPGTQTN